MWERYEQWEKRVERKGKAKGLALGKAKGLALGKAEGLALGEAKRLVQSLVVTYETRFGALSPALKRALRKVAVPESGDAWVRFFVTASAEEIAAAIREGLPPAR